MSTLAEFILVALALFLWESTLWLPLRGIALRRRGSRGRWRVLEPNGWFTTRNAGLIPMRLLPPDAGLAPCQAPPLLVDDQGQVVVEVGSSVRFLHKSLIWNDLRYFSPHLVVAGSQVRVSSSRCIGGLHRAKARGASVEFAIHQAWRLALSPGRAAREWRRWQLVSNTLKWNGPFLTLGFFIGLPMVYVYRGSLPTVAFALGLWFMMGWTAGHLWWLGKRVYPDARAALRMDALLALFVPFHAMRALEIASVHAMATTHPVALMLATRDLENPWLAGFIRRILHPSTPAEAGFSSILRPLLVIKLGRYGKSLDAYDTPPDRADDPEADRYCPRCHALYLEKMTTCADCQGLKLRRFGVIQLPPQA